MAAAAGQVFLDRPRRRDGSSSIRPRRRRCCAASSHLPRPPPRRWRGELSRSTPASGTGAGPPRFASARRRTRAQIRRSGRWRRGSQAQTAAGIHSNPSSTSIRRWRWVSLNLLAADEDAVAMEVLRRPVSSSSCSSGAGGGSDGVVFATGQLRPFPSPSPSWRDRGSQLPPGVCATGWACCWRTDGFGCWVSSLCCAQRLYLPMRVRALAVDGLKMSLQFSINVPYK
jgi:hypothetical protein